MKCNLHGEICERIEQLDLVIAHDAEEKGDGILNQDLMQYLAENDVDDAYNEPENASTKEREQLYAAMSAYAREHQIA